MKTEEEYKAEVLQLMRDLYPTLKGEEKERAERLFPELKESEDERMKRVLTEGFAILSKDEEWYDGVTVGQILAWFEKRGEQNPTDKVEQKHAEWSEEDERERKRVVGLLEGWLSTFKETNYAEDCKCGIDWLKSIKDRYTWKPSKKQMEQLGWIAEQNKDNMIGKELMSLYQDLKKLREE